MNLLKRVLFALFTDQRLWIAAGGGLLFLMFITLVTDKSDRVKMPKAVKGEAKKPKKGLNMPKLPNLKKKPAALPTELEDDNLDDGVDAKNVSKNI